MINHFISGVRSRREFTDVDTVPDVPVPAAHEDRAALRELGWAFDRLPPDQREALQMIALQEDRTRCAAEVTGCAIGTLKSRVHRARLRLRAHLTGEETPQRQPDRVSGAAPRFQQMQRKQAAPDRSTAPRSASPAASASSAKCSGAYL